ncbi:class III signal peptide-containing protein [Methanofervidicoccus abyssi]|uniref:Class III signal peptide n=1 Tax=Methanofervidicoccus abyssi TaxID=2082189 RepID=A0A401HQ31_9EURY|nr:class III signal peptide-containing protein [Methanofervidicoccus abyssi]GBF36387.1 hypothetical protein MHHB_P0617 [Methanofervidicoccus abyssi]
MILKKLLSKRAQISIEIGMLIAAAVAVATIAVYLYVSNVENAAEDAGDRATAVTGNLSNIAENYTERISNILGG